VSWWRRSFVLPDLLGGAAWATWGRLRYNHTQGILFGFLGNAFFAFLYHAVPRLAERPVLSRRLGWWLFGIWNSASSCRDGFWFAAGFGQPLEWAEFPLIVACFVVLGFILAIVQFVTPFLKKSLSGLYVFGLVHHWGAHLHHLGVPCRESRAATAAWCDWRCIQRVVDHDAVGSTSRRWH